MDFRTLMQVFVDDGQRYRQFKPIPLPNGFSLSVQADPNKYCTPRRYLPIENYRQMEIALLTPDGDLCGPDELPNKLPPKLANLFEGPTGCVVAGYVDIEDIQAIYDHFNP